MRQQSILEATLPKDYVAQSYLLTIPKANFFLEMSQNQFFFFSLGTLVAKAK